jgi:hypothetical protein
MNIEAVQAPSADEVTEGLALGQVTRPGLTFREVMSGMITVGVADPAAGYRDDAAIAMVLHADVTIPNLPAFLKDPEHRGRWRAGGSIPVLGFAISSGDCGDFGLFRRAIKDGKGVRELVYDTTIAVGENTYRMRGRKFVEPAPPWRGWAATTTLYVQLFGAGDTPVAAGILHLSPGAFARQLLSMRVTGKFWQVDKIGQLFSFLRFFVSSLANTYLKGRRW